MSDLILFNDGEALDYGDLNDLQDRLMLRMWDHRYYERAIRAIDDSDTYAAEYGTPTLVDARAFCFGVGGGLDSSAGTSLTQTLNPGVIGTYPSTSPPGSAGAAFRFVEIGEGEVSFTLDNNVGGGAIRFDLISFKVDQAAANNVARDFQDAITGALSSQLLDKATRLSASFTLTKGTPGAGVPATPAGEVALLAFGINDGASVINSFFTQDYRFPLDGIQEYVVPANQGFTDTGTVWTGTEARRSSVDAGASRYVIPCPVRKGRLIGVAIQCDISTSSAWRLASWGRNSYTQANLAFGADVSFPGSAVSYPIPESVPVWANGTSRGNVASSRGLALTIESLAASEHIDVVKFLVMGG